MQRLLGQHPEENAVIELNNLLATKSIKTITLEEVAAISKKYKVDFSKSCLLNLIEFYAVFLNVCLNNKSLTEEEVADLEHLKNILNLDSSITQKIHYEIAGSIYRKNFNSAIKDGILKEKQIEELHQLRNALKLAEATVNEIENDCKRNFTEKYLQRILSSGRLSPDMEEEFYKMVDNLGIRSLFTPTVKETFERLKLYWNIDNNSLNIVQVDLKLAKGENCYFTSRVNWYELRASNYTSQTLKLKKGETYLNQKLNTKSTSQSCKLTDTGIFYLTNSRILVVGEKKHSITFDKIDFFSVFSNGIEIDKEAGKDIFLEFVEDSDIVAVTFARLFREY